MTGDGFTIPEFIELLASSFLGGILTGVVIIYLYLRFRKRKFRRQQGRDYERNGAEENWHKPQRDIDRVIENIQARRKCSRATPSIPIQDPPVEPEENSSLSNYESGEVGATRAEVDTPDYDQYSEARSTPEVAPLPPPSSPPRSIRSPRLRPMSQSSDHQHTYTYPPTRDSEVASPGPASTYSRSNTLTPSRNSSNYPRRMGIPGQSGGADSAPLSRTATSVSTLPPYDTLSSGPPRYSSSRLLQNSPAVSVSGSGSVDQPSPVEPSTPVPNRWWRTLDSGSPTF